MRRKKSAKKAFSINGFGEERFWTDSTVKHHPRDRSMQTQFRTGNRTIASRARRLVEESVRLNFSDRTTAEVFRYALLNGRHIFRHLNERKDHCAELEAFTVFAKQDKCDPRASASDLALVQMSENNVDHSLGRTKDFCRVRSRKN